MDYLQELIKKCSQRRSWTEEAEVVSEISKELKSTGDPKSVRELGNYLGKSKSWVSMSIILAEGFRQYPELMRETSRSSAYIKLLKLNKEKDVSSN